MGDQAPDFTLKDVQGGTRSLKELASEKAVLVAFYKISCPVCQFTLPFLERLNQSEKVEVVAVSQDDAEGTEGVPGRLRASR